MMDVKAADLGKLLNLEQAIRNSADFSELAQIICNNARDLLPYAQAALARAGASGKLKVEAFSDIAVIDRTAPLVSWLDARLSGLDADAGMQLLEADDLQDIADLVPPFVAIVPLSSAGKGLLGAFVVTRTNGFSADEMTILEHLASVFGHALATHQTFQPISKLREGLSGRRKWGAAAAVLLLALMPVRLTAIAPATIVASQPQIIAAPMDGVVEKMLVAPNQTVTAGTPLVAMVDHKLASDLRVARRSYRVAEAELLRARQMAFSDNKQKAFLAELAAQVELKRSEVAFAESRLDRSTIRAPMDGLVVIDDVRKWQGRPVQTGEQMLKLADAAAVEVEILLPVADAVTLSAGSRADVFLDIAPLNKLNGTVLRVPYQSGTAENGVLAYRVKAALAPAETPPRIGLHGSAKLFGPRTTLFYLLFRRPITALRQMIGV